MMRVISTTILRGLPCATALLVFATPLSAQRAPDRSKPPAPGPAPALHLPAIEKLKLSNGLPVWLVEMHEVPVVQVNLVLSTGSADDPPGKFGVASLAMAMLTEGAGARSTLEIADAVDFLGADLGAASAIDSSAVRLHVPAARLAGALPIMADVALHPTFPADELERQRDDRLTDLLQSRDDPPTIAALAFARVLYGAEHRYGTATVGTGATIGSFTADDLRAFYRAAIRPDNATLLVVGDITRGAVVPLLESAFGAWKADGPAPVHRTLPAAQERTAREVYIVDKPGAPQSQVRIGWVGVPRSTPDYFPIQVMNTILGGSFSSRLNMNLREQHGYTYGAGSSFDMRASAGPFAATAGVQTDKTSPALTEFFKELDAILKAVPADELARAKNYVALRFPGGFETTADITRKLEDMLVYKLPDDYFAKYVQNIQAVTAADVQRVARKYVQAGRFAVVVAGDRATIEPGIRALALGPIHELTVDDVFGPEPKIGN
ncbi:MAG TPA: pitrilysin family protein [Gammaproteobacteria bacterium]|nr:pitrilysin family protein [Gammaproteobacteria bacterium]